MEEGVAGGAVEALGRGAALHGVQADTAVGLLGGGAGGGVRKWLSGPVLAAKSLEASKILEEESSTAHTVEVPHPSTLLHRAAHVGPDCLALHTPLGGKSLQLHQGSLVGWEGPGYSPC